LATELVGDHRAAEATVIEVIGSSFPASAMAVPMPDVEMRRHLARRVYVSCGSRPNTAKNYADCERAALALTRYGRLTYRATAALLGMSGTDVARCLGSALRRAGDSVGCADGARRR